MYMDKEVGWEYIGKWNCYRKAKDESYVLILILLFGKYTVQYYQNIRNKSFADEEYDTDDLNKAFEIGNKLLK